MMTSAQVDETSVIVTTKSSSKDFTHSDDHTSLTYDTSVNMAGFNRESKTENQSYHWG